MRLIDADKLIKQLDDDIKITSEFVKKSIKYDDYRDFDKSFAVLYMLKSYRAIVEDMKTAFDVDIRDTQLELHTIKLLTLGAKAYAIWFDIITSKMRGNDEIAKLFLELPTVQGTSNIMALERLKDSEIDVNSISSLEDVIKAIA